MSFLDPNAVARLGALPLKARIIVEGALTGLHRARLHGSSIEFSEHKEYSPGDEIRHIDWKAYAKVDRYYVKQFEQESQLTAHLVLDASASMAYAGQGLSKLEYASYLVAALAHLLIRQRDRVGLSVFGDARIDAYVPPRGRPAHLRDLFAVIDEVNRRGARGDEPAGAALERLAELARRRRSLVVLVSDLFGRPTTPEPRESDRESAPHDDHPPALDVLRLLKAQRHDVVVFHTLDRHELEFPFEGLTLFESLEDERKLLTNPGSMKRQYLQRVRQFLDGVEAGCTDSGVEYHRVATDQPLERVLLDFLARRLRSTSSARRT